MRRWKKINRISWQPPAAAALLVLSSAWWLRPPGLDVRDGRHDRGGNGIVLGTSWTAADATKPAPAISELARALREHHLTELYLQIPPPNADGSLPGLDSTRTEALLYECYDARGWAQIDAAQFHLEDPRWRRFFIVDVRRLLDRHPRLRGVSLDFSNASENPALLSLLEELHAALAPEKRPLAIVTGPWPEPFFREAARHADQLSVPLDVSTSVFSRFNVSRSIQRVGAMLAQCEGKPVLFRIPADARLRRGIATVHLGLSRQPLPNHYQGVVIESENGPTAEGWLDFRARFVKP